MMTTESGGERRERRQFHRVPCHATITAEHLPQPIPSHPARLLAKDLSEGGLRASTGEFIPLGSRLLLALESDLSAAPIRAVAAVVWVEQLPHQERWNLGIAFAEMSDETRVRLRGLLRLRVVPH